MTPDTSRWWDRIETYAREFNVDPVLVECIMAKESGGKADAVSPLNSNGSRDYGLMQLSSKGALAAWAANGHAAIDPMNPDQNLRVACWFLGKCIPADFRRLGISMTRDNLVVAYNAGPGVLLPGKSVPSSTKSYLAWVTSRYAVSTFPRAAAVADATAVNPSGTVPDGRARWGVLVGIAGVAIFSALKLISWK